MAQSVDPRRNRAKPGVSSGHRSRLNDEDSVRGPHQGQQSTRTAPTGRTHDCKRPLRCTPNDLLPGGGHPHMKRRAFITLLGGAAAWPRAAQAQQPAMPVIGFLHIASLETRRSQVASFYQGLKDTGYIEGENVTVQYRWAENQNDRMPALATDLVRRQVAVIAALSTPSVLAAKDATTTIPIVFLTNGDPVKFGLVDSLNRPGRNITGITLLGVEVVAKRFELLHKVVPTATIFGVLANPTNPRQTEVETREAQEAARSLGVAGC